MLSATAHEAIQRAGKDGPAAPSEPTGFAGPYEPMSGDQFGQLLQAYAAANADLHQRLIWGTDMVISMLGRTSRLVTDQANQARASEQSVRQQERELRDNLSGIFQRMLTMRKEQLDGREADLKRQLADKRESERSQMLGRNIEKGIEAFGRVGKLYMLREHPELLGLDDEAMELVGTLGSNTKLRELTRHPKFAAMVNDPKFAETLQQMLQFLDTNPEPAESAAS
jgi:hypothetical protein